MLMMQSIFSQSDVKGARSTALHAMQWLIVSLLSAVLATLYLNGPEWLLALFASAIVLALLVFFGAYTFLLVRNPDALRSEQFTLSKLAIEKGMVGDNVVGLAPASNQILAGTPHKGLTSDDGGTI